MESGDGESWKKRIPIFNISKLDFPPPSFSPGVLSEKSGLLLIILKRIDLRQMLCGKAFLIPPKVCRVVRNGKQNILMKSIGLG